MTDASTRLLSVSVLVGCTAPVEPGSLPSSELPMLEMTYAVEPDSPPPPPRPAPEVPPEPDHERALLLTSSSQASVFAVSDHHRLWISDADDQLHEVSRADDMPWIAAIDVDAQGKLWVLEGGGRLSVTAGPAWPPIESDIVPVAHASFLRVTPELVTVIGTLAEPRSWNTRLIEFPDELRVLAQRTRGQAWQISPTPHDGNMFDQVSMSDRGELQVLDGEESECGGGGQTRWSKRGRRAWVELEWPLDVRHDRHVGVDGWSYAVTVWESSETSQFVAVDRMGEVEALFEVHDTYSHAYAHGLTRVLTHEGLWSVSGNVAERIGPASAEVLALRYTASSVDARGRMLLLSDGGVHIGGTEGWTRVELPPR